MGHGKYHPSQHAFLTTRAIWGVFDGCRKWYSKHAEMLKRMDRTETGFYELEPKLAGMTPEAALDALYGDVLRTLLGAKMDTTSSWVMYNSNLWDHSHLLDYPEYYGVNGDYASTAATQGGMDVYSISWQKNTTRFLDFILDASVQASSPAETNLRENGQVILWTMNDVDTDPNLSNSPVVDDGIKRFITTVNAATRALAGARGHFLLDFRLLIGHLNKSKPVLKDGIHPVPEISRLLTQTATRMIEDREAFVGS